MQKQTETCKVTKLYEWKVIEQTLCIESMREGIWWTNSFLALSLTEGVKYNDEINLTSLWIQSQNNYVLARLKFSKRNIWLVCSSPQCSYTTVSNNKCPEASFIKACRWKSSSLLTGWEIIVVRLGSIHTAQHRLFGQTPRKRWSEQNDGKKAKYICSISIYLHNQPSFGFSFRIQQNKKWSKPEKPNFKINLRKYSRLSTSALETLMSLVE